MAPLHEIRADFDRETIVVYQAYSDAIADGAIEAGRFVPPFSLHRMTWIKPSFLWLMHRSNWGQKGGQERILAVRMTRAGWESALAMAVHTSFVPGIFRSQDDWSGQFRAARVHLQWDPERTIRGAGLPYYSIQVGLSRHVIGQYVDEWVTGIEDYSPRVRRMRDFLNAGEVERAKRLLPREQVYPVPAALRGRLVMNGGK